MHTFSELTAFIPILECDTFGEWIFDTENDGTPEHPIRAPYVLYTAAVDRFVKTLYRFCDGALLGFCKNGCIVRWLERLETIDGEADQKNTPIGGPRPD